MFIYLLDCKDSAKKWDLQGLAEFYNKSIDNALRRLSQYVKIRSLGIKQFVSSTMRLICTECGYAHETNFAVSARSIAPSSITLHTRVNALSKKCN